MDGVGVGDGGAVVGGGPGGGDPPPVVNPLKQQQLVVPQQMPPQQQLMLQRVQHAQGGAGLGGLPPGPFNLAALGAALPLPFAAGGVAAVPGLGVPGKALLGQPLPGQVKNSLCKI